MSTSDADTLAILRELAEYGGCEQREPGRAEWRFGLDGGPPVFGTWDEGIISPPYCDTLFWEVMRQLRTDGWKPQVYWGGSFWVATVHDDDNWERFWEADNPDHAVLALGDAMRAAGIIGTADTKRAGAWEATP